MHEQNSAFANLRQEGVYNCNVKLLNAGAEQDTFLCNRKQASKKEVKKTKKNKNVRKL